MKLSKALGIATENELDKKDESLVVEGTSEVIQEISEDDRFVIKVGTYQWLKSWTPAFELCKKKSDALVMNADWARGNLKRVTTIKRLKAEIVKL